MAGFNVESLPSYVDQNRGELLQKSLFGFETRKYINDLPGVKFKKALNIISTDPVLQARNCGWDASGNVDFTQRVMEVAPMKVNLSLCEEDLREKWMDDQLRTAAGAEVLPFEEKITGDIVKGVSNQLENLIWKATDASNGFKGLLTIMDAEPTVIDVAKGASEYETVLNVYKAIPAEILDKAEIFVGLDFYRAFVLEITAKNLYHYDPKVDDSKTVIVPGTNTPLHGVPGLSRTNRVVAADPEGLFYGYDGEADADTFDIWYSKDNQEFRVAIKLNIGSQIAFPDQVVLSAAE